MQTIRHISLLHRKFSICAVIANDMPRLSRSMHRNSSCPLAQYLTTSDHLSRFPAPKFVLLGSIIVDVVSITFLSLRATESYPSGRIANDL